MNSPKVKHPDRTAIRLLGFTYEYKVFSSREKLAKQIRKQEDQGASSQDWIPIVSLLPHEGFGC